MKARLAFTGRVFCICVIVGFYACSRASVPSADGGPSSGPTGLRSAARAKVLFVSALLVPGKLVSLPADSDGKTIPSTVITGSEKRPFGKTFNVAYDSKRNLIWVTSCINSNEHHQVNPILAFDAAASGDVKPVVSIIGEKTEMGGCQTGIAIGPKGGIFVADATPTDNHPGGEIVVFSADADGNVAPIRRIAGKNANLHTPESIVVRDNKIFVANSCVGFRAVCDGYVQVFSRMANGDVAPNREISGSKTLMSQPFGLALDSEGNVYVASQTNITVFRGDASGNVAPLRTLEGDKTKLKDPGGLAIDDADYLYVGNVDQNPDNPHPVLVFAPSADGNAPPIAAIDIDSTPWKGPAGVAVK